LAPTSYSATDAARIAVPGSPPRRRETPRLRPGIPSVEDVDPLVYPLAAFVSPQSTCHETAAAVRTHRLPWLPRNSKDGRMNLRDASDLLDTVATDTSRAYGQPYETADGTTIIPVTKLRGGALGVFVVKDGEVKFEAAVDATRIALMGILVGLVSASLAGAAMVRRPPWPDLYGDISKRV
jgi:hypothetical protein